MSDLFFGGQALWFSVAAIVGTLFFLLRMGFMLVGGGDADVDADFDVGADVDAGDVHDAHHTDSTEAFKILSVQSIAAFLMGFGWGGLGAFRGAGWDVVSSAAVGLIVGGGMVWLLGRLLKLVYGFQSSGNLPIHRTLDLEGNVYVTVPEHGAGRGKVRLIVGDRERYYTAVSDGETLETRARVRVVGVNDDNTLTVTRV